MSRTGFTRRLVTMGLAVMATASQNTGLSARAPAAPAESPTLKYYGAGSPTAEAQSWNEQSAREKSELLDVINPSPFALCSRALYLWLIFTPVLSTALPAFWSETFRNHAWYPLVCWTLARGGAAWIKWAQWASTRPDILPEALCAHLGTLQTQAPTHSFAYTRESIARTFGVPLEAVFDQFEPIPVASGSIAQVHFATYQGQQVAVKVRHPRVAERLSLDFRIMKLAAAAAEALPGLKWLNLQESVAAFSSTMTGQTFLDTEGNHLSLFARNFEGWHDVGFPTPLVASEEVLVESFESGRLVSDYTKLNPLGGAVRTSKSDSSSGSGSSGSNSGEVGALIIGEDLSISRVGGGGTSEYPILPPAAAHFLVTKGEDVYLKMLLADGLMHADLHPGNILLTYDAEAAARGDSNLNARIVLVDAGMVANLKPSEQLHFVGLLCCMGNGDGEGAAEHVLNFSTVQTCTTPTAVAAFKQEMIHFFAEHCRGYNTGIDLAEVLRGVLSLVRAHGVRIDVNYATLVMNALCLDGLAKAVLPGYNVLDHAAPLLKAHHRWGQGNFAASGFGRKVLKSVALPWAMAQKGRKDNAAIRDLAQRDWEAPGR